MSHNVLQYITPMISCKLYQSYYLKRTQFYVSANMDKLDWFVCLSVFCLSCFVLFLFVFVFCVLFFMICVFKTVAHNLVLCLRVFVQKKSLFLRLVKHWILNLFPHTSVLFSWFYVWSGIFKTWALGEIGGKPSWKFWKPSIAQPFHYTFPF